MRLLQLRHLHGRLRIEPRLLELLRRRLQSKLALLARELAREPCLLSLELCGILAKPRLLCRSTDSALSCLLGEACGL